MAIIALEYLGQFSGRQTDGLAFRVIGQHFRGLRLVGDLARDTAWLEKVSSPDDQPGTGTFAIVDGEKCGPAGNRLFAMIPHRLRTEPASRFSVALARPMHFVVPRHTAVARYAPK